MSKLSELLPLYSWRQQSSENFTWLSPILGESMCRFLNHCNFFWWVYFHLNLILRPLILSCSDNSNNLMLILIRYSLKSTKIKGFLFSMTKLKFCRDSWDPWWVTWELWFVSQWFCGLAEKEIVGMFQSEIVMALKLYTGQSIINTIEDYFPGNEQIFLNY